MKYSKFIILIIILTLLVLSACTAQYGKIATQTGTSVTIGELAQTFDQFHVFYGSRDGVRPSALIFDPKNNDTQLQADAWVRVTDSQMFAKVLQQIETIERDCQVREILSPDGRSFGLIYSPVRVHVTVRGVAPDTLSVSRLPLPVSPR